MSERLIAIQIGAVSFVDEGTEQVLDILQEQAGVTCLFLANFTYTRGTGGRQVPGFPLPDHGAQEYDLDFVGGNYGMGHAPYYRRTFIGPDDFRAREHGDLDILAAVLPAAQRRGLQTYCWIEESSGLAQARTIPNYTQVLELDARGRKGKRPCFNHPEYRAWHFGFVEDCICSYPVAGVAWCSERQGPLGNLLGGPWATGEVTCFCPHCRERAREQGIAVERARRGYLELEEFIARARQGVRPSDHLPRCPTRRGAAASWASRRAGWTRSRGAAGRPSMCGGRRRGCWRRWPAPERRPLTQIRGDAAGQSRRLRAGAGRPGPARQRAARRVMRSSVACSIGRWGARVCGYRRWAAAARPWASPTTTSPGTPGPRRPRSR